MGERDKSVSAEEARRILWERFRGLWHDAGGQRYPLLAEARVARVVRGTLCNLF